MKYEEFKCCLIENLTASLPCGQKIHVRKLVKNNGVEQEAILIDDGSQICPTYHLKDLFRKHEAGLSVRALSDEIAQIQKTICLPADAVEQVLDFSECRLRIYPKVIHYERNRAFLEDVPHRRILDLAEVYYYKVKESVVSAATGIIHTETLADWGIGEEELRKIAAENAERDLSLRIIPFEEEEEDGAEARLLAATSRQGWFGAASLFQPYAGEILKRRFPCDLFLLPSSIHEMLLLPYHPEETEKLTELVGAVNRECVEPEEVLSDRVYRFVRSSKEIVFA